MRIRDTSIKQAPVWREFIAKFLLFGFRIIGCRSVVVNVDVGHEGEVSLKFNGRVAYLQRVTFNGNPLMSDSQMVENFIDSTENE